MFLLNNLSKDNMKTIITLSLSLIISFPLYAQSIFGNVKDFKTNVNLDSVKVEINFINAGNSNIVYTDLFGNWSYTLTDVNDKIYPKTFEVYQNYPNPFNPSTILSFSVVKSANTRIEIYDILGRLVDAKEFFLQGGDYSIKYEGVGSAGIYFYTIKSGSNSITKKMIQLDGGNGKGLQDLQNGYSNVLRKSVNLENTELKLIFSKFAYVSDTLNVSVNGGEIFNTTIETVHSNAIMVDLHNDILERIFMEDPNYHLGDYNTKFETDIPRLKIGGVDIQLFVAWVSPTYYEGKYFETTIEMIDRFKYEALVNSEDLVQTANYSTSIDAIESNKIAGVVCVEGGHSIENSLDKLFALYHKGMRYLTITWNNSLDWAVSAKDSRSETVGLNQFGKDVIRNLDSLGVIIDVSHTGIQTIKDILEVTTNPIIATHSGVRAIKDHYRNLYDYQIVGIANSGGVIGLVFYPPFVGDPNDTGSSDIDDIIKHIDYIVDLVGIDHAAIGSDFDGTGGYLADGLDDVTKFPDLTYALLEHGYSQEEVKKILGENFLRVFKKICR